MRLYAGRLPFSMDHESLAEAFCGFGGVSRSTVAMVRETGRSRGFGFVERPDDEAARTAMKAMDGASMGGRDIKVNEARPRQGGCWAGAAACGHAAYHSGSRRSLKGALSE